MLEIVRKYDKHIRLRKSNSDSGDSLNKLKTGIGAHIHTSVRCDQGPYPLWVKVRFAWLPHTDDGIPRDRSDIPAAGSGSKTLYFAGPGDLTFWYRWTPGNYQPVDKYDVLVEAFTPWGNPPPCPEPCGKWVEESLPNVKVRRTIEVVSSEASATAFTAAGQPRQQRDRVANITVDTPQSDGDGSDDRTLVLLDNETSLRPQRRFGLIVPVSNPTEEPLHDVSAHVKSIEVHGDVDVRIDPTPLDLGRLDPGATVTGRWDLDLQGDDLPEITVWLVLHDSLHGDVRQAVRIAPSNLA